MIRDVARSLQCNGFAEKTLNQLSGFQCNRGAAVANPHESRFPWNLPGQFVKAIGWSGPALRPRLGFGALFGLERFGIDWVLGRLSR
jgi:hypothetical protein